MQNSIYKIKYLLFLSWDWGAWCLTVWGVITPPKRNTAWNKGWKSFHCLGAPNNLIRPWVRGSSILQRLTPGVWRYWQHAGYVTGMSPIGAIPVSISSCHLWSVGGNCTVNQYYTYHAVCGDIAIETDTLHPASYWSGAWRTTGTLVVFAK